MINSILDILALIWILIVAITIWIGILIFKRNHIFKKMTLENNLALYNENQSKNFLFRMNDSAIFTRYILLRVYRKSLDLDYVRYGDELIRLHKIYFLLFVFSITFIIFLIYLNNI